MIKKRIFNSIKYQIKKNNATYKFYVVLHVNLIKYNSEGELFKASPHFYSSTKTCLELNEFEELYGQGNDKLNKLFVDFQANGSFWIIESIEKLQLELKKSSQMTRINYTDSK